jgi:hypothetical protein
VNTYPITNEEKLRETNIIKSILCNNEYNANIIDTLIHKKQKKRQNNTPEDKHQKWAIFTYSTKEVRKITKLFRDAHIRIAFRTQNTIKNILKYKPKTDIYNKSGIYQMKCMECPKKYVGQTGRTFNIRYKEHIHDIRTNNGNTEYSNHILNTGHTYSPIPNTMEIITTGKKGKHLNILERYYIYKTNKENIQMNDTHIETYNPIFQAIHELNTVQ